MGNKQRAAQEWTAAQLRKYSKNHLRYEIAMFRDCGLVLQNAMAQRLQLGKFQENVFVEAFGIHLRALLEFFLHLETYKEDDVLAVDYMGAKRWTTPVLPPAVDDVVKKARERVNKEVGHLTTARKDDDDPTKDWRDEVNALLPELMKICRTFVEQADPNKLAAEVGQLVAEVEIPEPPVQK